MLPFQLDGDTLSLQTPMQGAPSAPQAPRRPFPCVCLCPPRLAGGIMVPHQQTQSLVCSRLFFPAVELGASPRRSESRSAYESHRVDQRADPDQNHPLALTTTSYRGSTRTRSPSETCVVRGSNTSKCRKANTQRRKDEKEFSVIHPSTCLVRPRQDHSKGSKEGRGSGWNLTRDTPEEQHWTIHRTRLKPRCCQE